MLRGPTLSGLRRARGRCSQAASSELEEIAFGDGEPKGMEEKLARYVAGAALEQAWVVTAHYLVAALADLERHGGVVVRNAEAGRD